MITIILGDNDIIAWIYTTVHYQTTYLIFIHLLLDNMTILYLVFSGIILLLSFIIEKHS